MLYGHRGKLSYLDKTQHFLKILANLLFYTQDYTVYNMAIIVVLNFP